MIVSSLDALGTKPIARFLMPSGPGRWSYFASIEVENAIASHPEVAQVAVIGVPDERWGEAVHAIVVPKPGCHPTEADIIAHARESIAGYKVPKLVEFQAGLPREDSGKIFKRKLRAPYWEHAGRQI